MSKSAVSKKLANEEVLKPKLNFDANAISRDPNTQGKHLQQTF